MNYRNHRYNAFGTIDCEVNHPIYGWISYTASPDDYISAPIYHSAASDNPEPYDPYSQPIKSIPTTISRFQARAALMDAGLLADVELALADADVLTQLAWAEAIEWRRDSPTIAAIGAALSLTSDDIDNLFIAAAQIKA